MELDFIGVVLEEIALEGLDGITLSTLWIRLKENPQFSINLDDKSKPFLWRNIVTLEDVEFYALKEPRPPLVLFNRFDYIDPETGLILEIETVPEDIYPFKLIRADGIHGSCATYFTRVKITEEVRRGDKSALISLQQAIDKWGERLVMVASQLKRNQVLMGTDFDPSYSWGELTYCILERIGRGRYMGELSRGKLSLSVFNEAPKTLFYHTKKLGRQSLPIIKKQTVCSKDAQNRQLQCRIFHLTRFFKEIRSKYTILREQLCDYLYKKPNHRAILSECRSDLKIEDKSFKKLYQNASRYVKVYQTYYRDIFPNATPDEYMNKNKVTERQLKIIELIKLPSKDGSDSDDEDEGDEEDEEDDDIERNNKIDSKKYEVLYERPLLYQVIGLLKDAGPTGVTLQSVKKTFSMDILESRMVVKYLVKMGSASMIFVDVGRQKKCVYIHKKFLAESDVLIEVRQEQIKMEAFSFSTKDGTDTDANQSAVGQDQITLPIEEETSTALLPCDPKNESKSKPIINTEMSETNQVTGRFLKRANWIMGAVTGAKLIDNLFVLVKMIRAKEKEEGSVFQVDKKSVMRIVKTLAKDGKLHLINTIIKVNDFEKQLSFVCDLSVQRDDQIVRSAIDQARHKQIGVRREHIRDANRASLNAEDDDKSLPKTAQQSIQKLQAYKSKLTAKQMVFDRKVCREYGLQQKMVKNQIVHKYLWYLCHGHHEATESSAHGIQVELQTKSSEIDHAQGVSSGMEVVSNSKTKSQDSRNPLSTVWLTKLKEPSVYVNDINWKRYLPKLSEYKGFGRGWCLISDVLLSLPVVLFCQVIPVNYKIPGLKELLSDPVRKFYPIMCLPISLTQQLLYARKYIFSFHEICVRLCHMGLLSFGTQVMKEKDQMFIYIHQNASLVDTRKSLPSYCRTVEPPNKKFCTYKYTFKTEHNVEDYWVDMKLFSLNTFLNTKKQAPDSDELDDTESQETVQLSLEDALAPREPSTIKDSGIIPGDGRGAAGMDSEMYCHLIRNWTQGTGAPKYHRRPPEFDSLPCSARDEKLNLGNSSDPTGDRSFPRISDHQRLPRMMPKERLTLVGSKGKKPEVVKVTVQKNTKGNKGGKGIKRKKVDKIPLRREKRHRLKFPKTKKPRPTVQKMSSKLPWSDEIDKQILDNQELQRVIWTPKEDSILLICQVASLVMDKKRKGIVVPWTVVRNVMHQYCPNVKSPKTSKSCQRRVRFALLNPQTRQNVSLFLEEALHDDDIASKFRDKLIKFTDFTENHKDYVELVQKLMQKFSRSVDMTRNILPGSFEDLERDYKMTTVGQLKKVRRYKDVENKRDICYGVVQNILHSYLSLQDKQGRSHEMFRLLSQYPDDLLLDVITGMRSDGTVTKIKTDNRNLTIPTGTIMHDMKLTQRYDFIFKSRYPPSLFDEAHKFLMLMWDECSKPKGQLRIADQVEGGHCAALVALTYHRKIHCSLQIPEEIITLDAENMFLFPYGRGKVSLPMLLAAQSKYGDDSDQSETLRSAKSKQILSNFRCKGIVQPKKDTLFKNQKPSLAKVICPASEIVFLGEPDESSTEDTSNDEPCASLCIKATHASRSLLCLLRTQSLKTKEIKAYNMQDNFVINTCPIKLMFKTPEGQSHETRHQNVAETLFLDEERAKQILEEQRMLFPFQLDVDNLWIEMKKSENLSLRELKYVKHLYKKVEGFQALGVRDSQLQASEKDSRMYIKCLAVLIKHQAIIKVSLTSRRFVAFCHARPWMTHSYKNTRGHHPVLSKQVKQTEIETDPLHDEKTQSKEDNSAVTEEQEKTANASTLKKTTAKRKRLSSVSGDDITKTPKQWQKGRKVSRTSVESKTTKASESELAGEPDNKKKKHQVPEPSSDIEQDFLHSPRSSRRLKQGAKRKKSDSDIFVSSEEEKQVQPVSTYEKVRFVSRPWRKPEGRINKPVLKVMLESVLLWVMSNPGCTDDTVYKRYMPHLQPGMIRDIIDILEDLGCVTKTILREQLRPSLFSKPSPLSIVEDYREEDIVVYDGTVDAVFRLGHFCSLLR